jgi:hypothetical protein
MLLSDYISQVQFLVHDSTNADFSAAELTAAINNARTAVSLDFHCVRQLFIAPPNNAPISPVYTPISMIQNVEAYPLMSANGLNGQVVGIKLTNGGSHYTPATTVTVAAGPTGSVRATAVPVIVNGVITRIDLTQWGQGYTPALPGSASLPAVTITDSGGGTGAVATAVMFNNVFNVISISYIWGNQRYMLKFRGFTLFQAYMRALLTFNQRAMIWTIHEQTGVVLIQPPPDQAYVSEWDVLALPQPLVNPTDADTQVMQPWADAVQYYAAMLCLNKLQNFEQAQYYLGLYSARVPKIIIGAGGIRIPNPYHRTFQRRVAR